MLEQLKRVIFFGAHTDDEMIAAGTLHRLVQAGCEVQVVTFAPAAIETDRTGGFASSAVTRHEWWVAMDAIGVDPDHCWFLDLIPSAELPRHAQLICQYAYDHCEKHKPDAVITLSPDDENTAHAVVGREVERVLRGRVPVALRCQFPWNFSLGRPNLFVSLDEACLEVKRQVIDAYESQRFRYRYHEMLMAYAMADGASVKVLAAEKFELLRAVI